MRIAEAARPFLLQTVRSKHDDLARMEGGMGGYRVGMVSSAGGRARRSFPILPTSQR